MNETSPTAQPIADEIPADLRQLADACEALPLEFRRALAPLVQQTLDSTRRRRRILNLVQDALSQLRLDMKYLMFDLEATRRERDGFRKLLDDADVG